MKAFLLFAILGLALCLNHTNKTIPHPIRRENSNLGNIINDGAKVLGNLLNHQGQQGSENNSNDEELFDWSDWGKGVVQVFKTSPYEFVQLNHTNKTIPRPAREENSKMSDTINNGAKALGSLFNHNQDGEHNNNGEELFDWSDWGKGIVQVFKTSPYEFVQLNHTNKTISHPVPRPVREENSKMSDIVNSGAKALGSLFNHNQGSENNNNGEELFDWSDWGKGIVQVFKTSPYEFVQLNHTNKTIPHPVREENSKMSNIINSGAKALGSLFNHNQGSENNNNGEELFDWSDWGKGVVQVFKTSPYEFVQLNHTNKTVEHAVPKKSGFSLGGLFGNSGNFLGKFLGQGHGDNAEEQF